jgi:uncharacterized protein YndB with AHSA1/START domain
MTTLTLPSEREMVFTQTFDAPRARVFSIMHDPAHIPNWWGPRYLRTVVETMDFRPGGKWRFLQYAPDGTVHAFNGEYVEIVVPERVVSTFEYEPWSGHVSHVTHSLEERGGKTTLTSHHLFPNRADRDAMMNANAKQGYDESMERLTEILAAGARR